MTDDIISALVHRIRSAQPDITRLVVTRKEVDQLRRALDLRYEKEREEAEDLELDPPPLPWCSEAGFPLLYGVEVWAS